MCDFKLPGEIVVDGMYMPGEYFPKQRMDQIQALGIREGDILIATYPKSGTTWVSEIAYLLNSDFDFDSTKKNHIMNRVPFLEFRGTSYNLGKTTGLQTPHMLRSHLPFRYYSKHVMDGSVKVVVVQRNPKDVLVSYYGMYKANKTLGNYKGTWEQYLEMFYAKKLAFGDWFDRNKIWWEQRHLPNILFLKYEDMKINIEAEILKLAHFMGKEISVENMVKLKEHVKFESMQENVFVNPKFSQDAKITKFFRKGVVGDWKNQFTVEQNEKFDEVYMPQILEAGMELKYE